MLGYLNAPQQGGGKSHGMRHNTRPHTPETSPRSRYPQRLGQTSHPVRPQPHDVAPIQHAINHRSSRPRGISTPLKGVDKGLTMCDLMPARDTVCLSQAPNARHELLPEAGATQERTLEAISSRPLILIEAPSSTYHRGLLGVGKSHEEEEETSGDFTPHSTKRIAALICTHAACTCVSSARMARSCCLVP